MVCPICIATTIATVSAPAAITAVAAIKLRQMQVKQERDRIRYLTKNHNTPKPDIKEKIK